MEGFKSKKDSLQIALHELQETGNYIDLICLSEIFIKRGCENNIQIKGFKLDASYCRTDKNRGGVCILSRNYIDTFDLKMVGELSIPLIFECCGVEIPEYECIIVCLYTVPNPDKQAFLDRLDLLLYKLRHKIKNRRVIIAGDYNINTLKDTPGARQLKSILENHGLKLHIHTPTRINTCIDNIASNINEAQGRAHRLGISDHDTAQVLTFTVTKKKLPPKQWFTLKRDYSQENINKFKECLQSLSWTEVYNAQNFKESFSVFHELITMFYKLCFPIYKLRNKSNCNGKLKWLTKGLKISCVTKRNLRFEYYRNKTNTNKSKYTRYSKALRKCIQWSQKNHNSNFVRNSKNTCKAAWQLIKYEDHNYQQNREIQKIKINDNIINNSNDIAEAFNNYFIDIITNSNTISNHQNNSISNINNQNSTIFLTPCDESEALKTIRSLNNTTATGFDEIDTKILKCTTTELTPVLTFLANQSLVEGEFPTELKISVVKPIFKKDDKENMSKYRPVTLVPILSKFFEKIFFTRLTGFISKHRIIKREQNGFQKGKSTTLACFNMVKILAESIDSKIPTLTVFFDMTKAFDYVHHDILLAKCEKYGIRGPAYNWIESYLKGRTQLVEINKLNKEFTMETSQSKLRENRFGVPQGSILGPLLFLLYINDLPDVTEHQCTLYADDISIIIKYNNTINFENDVNNTIKKIVNWLQINNLRVNIDKTTYMTFYNRIKPDINVTVQYNNSEINESKEMKFLGITLDSQLSWKAHLTNIIKKINKFVFVLYRLVKVAGHETAMLAYHGYVVSALRYGIVVWGNAVEIDNLFLIQKKCVRAICGMSPVESCRPLFKKLNLLTLTGIYIFEICVFVRQNMDIFIKKSTSCYFNTRFPNRLTFPKSHTVLLQRNCYWMAIKIFNSIPKELQDMPFEIFKHKLRKWLISKCFYNIKEFLDCTARF